MSKYGSGKGILRQQTNEGIRQSKKNTSFVLPTSSASNSFAADTISIHNPDRVQNSTNFGVVGYNGQQIYSSFHNIDAHTKVVYPDQLHTSNPEYVGQYIPPVIIAKTLQHSFTLKNVSELERIHQRGSIFFVCVCARARVRARLLCVCVMLGGWVVSLAADSYLISHRSLHRSTSSGSTVCPSPSRQVCRSSSTLLCRQTGHQSVVFVSRSVCH